MTRNFPKWECEIKSRFLAMGLLGMTSVVGEPGRVLAMRLLGMTGVVGSWADSSRWGVVV